jgi:hypothetical protein
MRIHPAFNFYADAHLDPDPAYHFEADARHHGSFFDEANRDLLQRKVIPACIHPNKEHKKPVLRIRIRIRIHRIHMCLDLLDPDPSVRGMDSDPAPDLDPSITKQKK